MNTQDILDHAAECGKESAANLLLLVGPDGFDGSYEEYKELETMLNREEVRS